MRGIAFMEAMVRPLRWSEFPPDFRTGFRLMRTPGLGWFMISVMNMFVKQLLPGATVRGLSDEAQAYYAAAFPTVASRKPVRQWPLEIPIDGKPSDMHELISAYSRWLTETELPKMVLYGKPGGIIDESALAWCQDNMANLVSVDIGEGIHYLQEDNPDGIGEALADWFQGLA